MRRRLAALTLAAFCLTGPGHALGLELAGRVPWEGDVVQGISGLEVSSDGQHFTAVSDAGWRYAGRLIRRDGTLESVVMDEVQPILGVDGLPVSARRVRDWADAEGLATAPDGTSWISFERWSRVQRHAADDPAGQWIKDHPDFAEQRDNRQLEAVAVDAAGTVFTIPERPEDEGFPIYALRPEGWVKEGRIPYANGFSVVGADFGPDGTLWLLERKLLVGLWWQNRIRRLDPGDPGAAEIVWTGELDEFYNLEGIAVWDTTDGLRLLCVTDNNARANVVTEFVEFRLID